MELINQTCPSCGRTYMGIHPVCGICLAAGKDKEVIKDAEIIEEPAVEEVVEEKPFCDYCDSKGGRHKKDCTRPE